MSDTIFTAGSTDADAALVQLYQRLTARVGPETVPTGILHWSLVAAHQLDAFDGEPAGSTLDQPLWEQLYYELQQGALPGRFAASLDVVRERAAARSAEGVPIALAHFRYDGLRSRFVTRVLGALQGRAALDVDTLDAGEARIERRAFFASALLPVVHAGIERLPSVHCGLDVAFRIEPELYLTNTGETLDELRIDFDDDQGYRTVGPGATDVHYEQPGRKLVRLEARVGGRLRHASFHFAVEAAIPRVDETWRLMGVAAYNGVTAAGHAWVFYGKGNRGLTRPVIIAEGFPGGYPLSFLWRTLDARGFATQLLDQGRDLIILGFGDGTTWTQANAYVAVACIQRAIRQRSGSAPLAVGGCSMGGLVTRYALLYMEQQGLDHQAETYFSVDTPHNGASIPMGVQTFAHFFRSQSADAADSSRLLGSAAAQQMLYHWIPDYTYAGPIGNNPHKLQFRNELMAMGWFPRKPRKRLGVSNGAGTGLNNGVPNNALAVHWHGNIFVWADVFTLPQGGSAVKIGEAYCIKVDPRAWTFRVSNVPAYDGAPGGWRASYGTVGDGARGSNKGWVDINHRNHSFVPTISGLSLNVTSDPYFNVSSLGGGGSDFSAYLYSPTNDVHVNFTVAVGDWLLKNL